MQTMTEASLTKQAKTFLDSLSYAQFRVDGILKDQMTIWKKERSNNVIRIYLMIGYEYEGLITDIKIIDKDGVVVITSAEQWVKPAARGIYITFKYKYLERAVEAIE